MFSFQMNPFTYSLQSKLSFKVHNNFHILLNTLNLFSFQFFFLLYFNHKFVVYFFFQTHVEVNLIFVEKFNADFVDKWDTVAPNGSIVTLDLTKNYYNPTLTNGWITLQQYYNFLNNVHVMFAYYGIMYGFNIFKVQSFHEVNSFYQLPTFHTRSLRQNETKFFDLQLWDGLSKRNNLVKTTLFPFNCYFFSNYY